VFPLQILRVMGLGWAQNGHGEFALVEMLGGLKLVGGGLEKLRERPARIGIRPGNGVWSLG
jgi:hypothetical protein